MMELSSRYRRALLGLAAGDAPGTTLEFRPPDTTGAIFGQLAGACDGVMVTVAFFQGIRTKREGSKVIGQQLVNPNVAEQGSCRSNPHPGRLVPPLVTGTDFLRAYPARPWDISILGA
jgi:hypothetical protein